jgi:hypothetical protein
MFQVRSNPIVEITKQLGITEAQAYPKIVLVRAAMPIAESLFLTEATLTAQKGTD